MNWISLFGKISIWIILLPLFVGALNHAKFDVDSKLIFSIVIIGTIPQMLNPFLKATPELTFLYNLYTPLEFLIYWYLFYLNVSYARFKKACLVLLALFLAFSLYLVSCNNLFMEFITVWVVMNNIFQLVLVGICLLGFYYEDGINFTTYRPLFWYILGIVLYASCTVVFYSLWDYLKRNSATNVPGLNLIHHIFNILLYIFFTGGFLANFNRTTKLINE